MEMTKSPKVIHNPKSGQVYKFLRTGQETNGELLEMEVTYQPHSDEPPAHYHPQQTEHFRVISGEMTVRIGHQLQVLKVGDTLEVPPNTHHSMWNNTPEPTIMHWVTTPALNTKQFFETLAGLAKDGKTNAKGVPKLLQVALTMPYFFQEIRLTKPPFIVQQIVFGLLKPVAYLLGYKPVYKQYFS